VLIFPEGSRTRDGNIDRFHKGAFYLAQQLDIPLSRYLVHGIGHVLPAGGFMLQEGSITIKYIGSSLIDNSDPRAYYHVSKETCIAMRQAYKELCPEIETPYHLRHQLIANYIYKGPVLENYIKIKIRLEKYYEIFDRLIPRKASITDIGCGYGPMTFMLCLRSKERNILALDYDENKIELAQNCELAIRYPVKFVAADATNYDYPASDVFLISDMLHYLPAEKQTSLVNICISKLNPNGMIIIRDGDNQMGRQHFGTKLSEFFSTNLGFNKTTSKLNFFSHSFVEKIAMENKLQLEIIDDSKLTSNRIYILRR
jgi:2-polyprenyl-3-methyl-5-hydroxy-6-metoxy-1,4-benzoquinol methylase